MIPPTVIVEQRCSAKLAETDDHSVIKPAATGVLIFTRGEVISHARDDIKSTLLESALIGLPIIEVGVESISDLYVHTSTHPGADRLYSESASDLHAVVEVGDPVAISERLMLRSVEVKALSEPSFDHLFSLLP